MKVRLLKDSDALAHERVASQAYCFSIDESCVKLPGEIMPGAFDDEGRLMADMEVGTRYVTFNGHKLKCAAVGGVASKPEFRNRGAVRALFNETFSTLNKEHKWDISILYPFSFAYYRKFGYENAGYCLKLTIPFTEISHLPFETAELYDGKKENEILDVYFRCSSRNNLSFMRINDGEFASEPYRDKRYTYFINDRDYCAYATFSTIRNERIVSVSEIGYTDRKSLEKILGFLNSYSGNYDTLIFEKIPEYNDIEKIIQGNKKYKCEKFPMGAVRILNPMSVLSSVKYPESKGSFTLRTVDEVSGIDYDFRIDFENGESVIEIIKTDNPDVILDSNSMIVLLTGIDSVCDSEYVNGMKVINPDSDFFKVFTPNHLFFNDGF